MEPYAPQTLYSDLPQVPKLPTHATLQPQERVAAASFRQMLQAEPIGHWGADRWAQVQRYTGPVYIAIKPVLGLWRSASYTLMKRVKPRRGKTTFGPGNAVAKSMPGPQSKPDDEYIPFDDDDHPLVSRLHCPNSTETFGELAAKMCLQFKLTGVAPLWCLPNEQRKPVEFWSLKTPFLYPVYQISKQYPRGAWRVNPYAPGGWNGALPGGMGASGAVIPGEEVKRFMDPHPWLDWDGYSALQAGAVQLDVLGAIDEARKNAMDRGVTLDTYVVVPGADQATLDRMTEDMRQKHGGSRNHRSFAAFGTSSPDSKATFQTTNARVIDMDFPEGWKQMTEFCLAIFRVPKAIAFTESGGYASDYAARQQFRDEQQDDLTSFGLFLTESLAWPWSSFPGEYVIKADAGKAENLELQEEQLQFDVGNDGITHNEYRILRNRKPVPDGDIPHSVFLAKQQQEIAPPPQPVMPGMDPNAMGSDPNADPAAIGQPEDAAPEDATDQDGQAYDSPESFQEGIAGEALAALGVPADETVMKATDKTGHKHKDKGPGGGQFTAGGGSAGRAAGGKTGSSAGSKGDRGGYGPKRHQSRVAPGFTYGNKDDRDSDDKHFSKQVRDADREVKKIRAQLEAAEKRLAGSGGPPPLPGARQQPPPLPQSHQTPPASREEHKQRIQQAAPRVASSAAKTPNGKDVLARAKQWAAAQADKHADKVAAHLGISRASAHHILRTSIEMLCEAALRGESKTLEYTGQSGQKIKLGVTKKPGATATGPTRPTNPAGKGSLAPRPGMRKALESMNELSGSAGGFLVPETTRKRKRKRKMVRSDSILKGL